MQASEEQSNPDRFSPIPEAGDNNDQVKKLRVNDGDPPCVMNDKFKAQAGKDQEDKNNRVGAVQRLPPGSTNLTFRQDRTSRVIASG